MPTKINICIVVDRKKLNKRRYCYWEDVLDEITQKLLYDHIEVNYDIRSIADEFEEKRGIPFDIFEEGKYDIIIFNWNSLNGDPQFNADKTLHLVKGFQQEEISTWVGNRNILMVEAQTRFGKLSQEAYDAILGDNELKVGGTKKSYGVSVICNKKYQNHPIIKNLKFVLESKGTYFNKSAYPSNLNAERYKIDTPSDKIHVGYFELKDYKRSSWKPLLLSKDRKNRKPTMLIKYQMGKERKKCGAYIVTSMFLASSDQKKLIESIIRFSTEVNRYYVEEREVLREKSIKKIKFAFILGTIWLIVFVLWYLLSIIAGFTLYHFDVLIVSLLGPILGWLLNRIKL